MWKIIHVASSAGIQTRNLLIPIPSYHTHKTIGQSYKGSTIVNYDSRVIIWGIFKSGTTLEL